MPISFAASVRLKYAMPLYNHRTTRLVYSYFEIVVDNSIDVAYSGFMFTIEKDIPVVPRNAYVNGTFNQEIREVLQKMETGDSFAYEDATPTKTLNRTIRAIGKSLGYKITVRRIKDGQFRTWKL